MSDNAGVKNRALCALTNCKNSSNIAVFPKRPPNAQFGTMCMVVNSWENTPYFFTYTHWEIDFALVSILHNNMGYARVSSWERMC